MARNVVAPARLAAEAVQLLGEEGVRDGLALEAEDIAVLKAISRGENVARADRALTALRLRLEWSAPKPAQTLVHGVSVAVLDPYSDPSMLPPLPGAPQLAGQAVVEAVISPVTGAE